MPNKQAPLLIKNDHPFTIHVKIGEGEYVVPPDAVLQSLCDDQIYLSFPGDAPMLAVPLTADPIRVAIPDRRLQAADKVLSPRPSGSGHVKRKLPNSGQCAP